MDKQAIVDQQSSHRQYWCFISYRHDDDKEEGRQWASWLHHELETYEVPHDLVGTTNQAGEEIPNRIFPVFRDDEELEAGGNLTDRICQALDNSRALIVLCSPQAVESSYVEAEIQYFRSISKEDRIYAVIIEGEPSSPNSIDYCFPQSLLGMNQNAEIQKDRLLEPIAADLRLPDGGRGWTSADAYRRALKATSVLSRKEIDKNVTEYTERLRSAKLKLVSGILCVSLNQLTRRDEAFEWKKARERKKDRAFHGAAGAASGSLITSGIGSTKQSYSQTTRAKQTPRGWCETWGLRFFVWKKG